MSPDFQCAESPRPVHISANHSPALLDRTVVQLLPAIRARARRFAARRRVPGYDAEDLAQAACLGLLRGGKQKLNLWDPEKGLSFDCFFLLLVEREFLRVLTHAQRQRRGGAKIELIEFLDDAPVLAENPEAILMATAITQRWLLSIAALPERGRQIFELLWIKGRSVEQTARKLGINRQVVYNWRHRIRKLIDPQAIATEETD